MAGPFLVKHGKTRAKVKIYAILFVCCVTRAINIEAVEDASSAGNVEWPLRGTVLGTGALKWSIQTREATL